MRRAHLRLLAAVFLGGTVGAALRAALTEAVPVSVSSWPWMTFGVNLGGCVLLAYFATRLQERLPPTTYKRPFLGTGLCGALTTFSTLQLELVQLGRDGRYLLAFGYESTSIATGLVAVFVVTALTRRARLAR